MRGRPRTTGRIARIVRTASLTIFFMSTATIAVFYSFFGDQLIVDAVRRVMERTFGYRVFLTGIRSISLNGVTVEGMDLVVGSTVFSSGPATIEMRPGLTNPLVIRKITIDNPSLTINYSGEGAGDPKRIIQKLMEMDVVVKGGDLVIIDKGRRYLFIDIEAAYERRLVGGSLTISGSAVTEGQRDGPVLGGPINGVLIISGQYPDLSIRGRVSVTDGAYRIGGFVISAKDCRARVLIDGAAGRATDVSVTGLSVKNGDLGLDFEDISGGGEMALDKGGSFALGNVILTENRIGRIVINVLTVDDGGWGLEASFDPLKISPANLAQLGDIVPDYLRGWDVHGKVHGDLSIGTVKLPDGRISGEIDVRMTNVGASSPDALFMGEGSGGNLSFRFQGDGKQGIDLDARASLGNFQLLMDSFFIDGSNEMMTAMLDGTLARNGSMRDIKGEIYVLGVMSAGCDGNIAFGERRAPMDLAYRIRINDMGRAFEMFLTGFLANRAPRLSTAVITGTLVSRGRITGYLENPLIRGTIVCENATVDIPDAQTKVAGLSITGPFLIEPAGTFETVADPLKPDDYGSIGFDYSLIRGIGVGPVSIDVALDKNRLGFKDEAKIPISGGSVTISRFEMSNIFSENRTMSLAFDADDIDIAGLLPTEMPVKLEGVISGGFSDVSVHGKKLFTSGALTATMYTGTVEITDIRGDNVFDAGRSIGFDVRFSGIDLGVLTKTVNIGEITGVVDGRIDDLVLAYGSPQRFRFDVFSTDRPGIKKRVSVDFVDNMTILGSGSTLLSGVLKGGLNQFISDYGYSKIGIHLELADDYFTLRGTIHEGDTEYFIKRHGPVGINVINQNPDNRIRFNDMIKRLERINVKNTEDIRVKTRREETP